MRSLLFLNLIYKVRLLILSGLLFSPILYAGSDDMIYKVNVGLYNPKGDDGVQQEDFKSYLNFGAQYGLSDSFSISLDTYISDEVDALLYLGGSLNYTYKVSDGYDIFSRLGGDVMEGEFVPKASFGIAAHLSKTMTFNIESTVRSTDEFSEYQFSIGLSYKFGNEGVASTLPVKTSGDKPLESIIEPDYAKASDHRVNYPDNESNKFYVIVKGDTLWDISERFNIELSKLILMNANVVNNPDLIYPCTRLTLK